MTISISPSRISHQCIWHCNPLPPARVNPSDGRPIEGETQAVVSTAVVESAADANADYDADMASLFCSSLRAEVTFHVTARLDFYGYGTAGSAEEPHQALLREIVIHFPFLKNVDWDAQVAARRRNCRNHEKKSQPEQDVQNGDSAGNSSAYARKRLVTIGKPRVKPTECKWHAKDQVGIKRIASDSNEATNSSSIPHSKRPRVEIRLDAAKILSPRLFQGSAGEKIDFMAWKSTDKLVQRTAALEDTKDLRAMLFAISKGDINRAGMMLSKFLCDKSNEHLKDMVFQAIKSKNEYSNLSDFILAGIKDSISHHSLGDGTRAIAAETFVKNVVVACLFRIVKDGAHFTNAALSKAIGVTFHQVTIARTQVQKLLETNSIVSTLQRKPRKDFVRVKAEPYVYDFLQDDAYTKLDPKKVLTEVIDPRTGEKVMMPKRIWFTWNKHQQHELFLRSDYYLNQFQRDHNGATIGYTVWMKLLAKVGTFVRSPPKNPK